MLKDQVREFKPISYGLGETKLISLATMKQADMIVVAVVGMVGLAPTLAAIRSGKDIALATKEVLVIAGELVVAEAKKHKVNIVPIDSEHSALFQSMKSGKKEEIKKLILTMGKGSIARMKTKDLHKVTFKDMQNRPVWDLGNKIMVDSATCLNKSFEIIEARWLFGVLPEQISVVVHPEYICHSLVEFKDGSIITELGTPDMKRYIQYALFYPLRKEMRVTKSIELSGKTLSFEKAPFAKFPGLQLGFDAIIKGGTMPAVLHGADETAVKYFHAGKITFVDIPQVIKNTMDAHTAIQNPTLKDVVDAETWAKAYAEIIISQMKNE
ncbi:1-deoxy-D-xylulose-5-phosphate reductoisomerase [Candidatus Roizmanbacteria bacterium CG_4_10_14_0_8_um_filter_39_9]|uniref:1-deoxy-D-xylulose 5-phosphate reductoisomerase n=1 Tax=Candidatus Roizmanbacteria bacterium CG_4_10_14_0_8_um_filter_39_9 TaxID=1974829 RepID=A0A2M7QE87_9BACT|nr:MAG: 1-deoxy-D-xylulose-5-phosphate reductoisomerase [Candidatus Roizmanbacteria bacterium CG_4_10_14_0_8_um_filter_39_9]